MNASRLRIIQTKLLPPRLGTDVIARVRLQQRMERASDCTVTVIAAPAGTGKSTLAAQWAAGAPLPVAWLLLDAADSNLATFVTYLVAAIRRIFPRALSAVEALVRTAARLPADYVADQLINELAELPGDFALVLDDYHVIHDQDVHALLSRVLEFAPPQLHLVIATRIEPPLTLGRLRASGRLLEVRVRDLRFTGEEIGAFMESALRRQLPADVVSALEEHTEGWGVGLRMAALSLAGGSDARDLANHLQAGRQHVFVYLANEVLAKQPEAVQAFLLATSLLERMCAPLCDALLDVLAPPARMPARIVLDTLHRANLFVTPNAGGLPDGPTTWYRYHALFREFLAAHLRERVDAATIRALHTSASRWFAAEGFVEEALHHALQAHDLDALDAVVGGALTEVLNSEDRQRLDRWLALVPPHAQRGRTGLTLARCWQNQWNTQVFANDPLLAEQFPVWDVDAPLTGFPAEIGGQVDLLQASIAYERRQLEPLILLAGRAVETLPGAADYARGLAYVYLGRGLQMAGREKEFRLLVEAEMQRADHSSAVYTAHLESSLMGMFLYTGQWLELRNVARRLYGHARRHGLIQIIARAHYSTAMADFQCSRMDTARQHFASVVDSPYTAPLRWVVDSLIHLALIFVAEGEPARAAEALDKAEQFVDQSGSERMGRELQAARAYVLLERGHVLQAYQAITPVRELTLSTEQLSRYLGSGSLVVRILLAYNTRGSVRQAQELTERLLAAARAFHFGGREVEMLVLQAEIRRALGDEAGALDALECALTLAEPQGGTRSFVQAGACIADLLRRLAARGVAVHFTQHLLHLIAAAGSAPAATPGVTGQFVEPLTNRELDVLELVAQRWSNKEVAAVLVISPMTVQRHLTNIFQKLAADNRRDAVAKARALGLLG